MARSRSRSPIVSAVLALVAHAQILACRPDDAPPPELTLPQLEPLAPLATDVAAASCGFDVLDDRPPAIDPCTGGEVLLGPETVTRDTGAPEDLSWPFSIAADGVVCLIVENDGLSSARFLLDEETVIGPERFNPRVERIEEQAAASAGAHVLWARVASGPRRSLTWTLRFAAGASPESVEFAGDRGLLTVTALRDAPDPFSPNGDARFDATELAVTARVARYPGSRHFQYAVASVFEVYSGESCGRVRSLTAVAEADPRSDAAYTTAASWDGMDEAGAVVPDGVYFYRAVTRFVRVNSGGVVEVFDEATTAFRPVRVDTQPPSLTLDPDVEGLITAETPLVVTGYVHDEVDVRVLVNGNEAALVDYRFSGEASLAEGPNDVVVEAIDAAGNSESLVRQVTLDTQPPVLGPATLEALPAEGAEVGTLSPRFVVSYEDSPAGVFGGGVSLRVNGSEQRRDSAITDVGIDLVLASVRAGTNSLVLVVPDRAGNESRLEVSFVVRAGWEVRVTDPASTIFGAALVVPAGAVPAGEDPAFTLDRFGAGVPALAPGQPAGAGMVLAGPLVEAGPSGTVFEAGTPAELTLPYDPGALGNPGGVGYVPEEFVRVARLVNPDDASAGAPPEFEAVAGPYRIDPARNTVTVRVEHLTPFAATTSAIPPQMSTARAFLASRGLAADADETIEVIDLRSMRPTGQRFDPRQRVSVPNWAGQRCKVRTLRMSPDDGALWAVLGCLYCTVHSPYSDFCWDVDRLAVLDAATLRLLAAYSAVADPLARPAIRDLAFSEDGAKVFALVDVSAGARAGHGLDGIYELATDAPSGTRLEPMIRLPVGTSGSLLVGRASIDPDGPGGTLPPAEHDVAAVATIEGQRDLTLISPTEPAFWRAASGEDYRAALEAWGVPLAEPDTIHMNSWGGFSYGIFAPFSSATGDPLPSGYATYRSLLDPDGCSALEFDATGAISNWTAYESGRLGGVVTAFSPCGGVPPGVAGYVYSSELWRLSDGHLFGALVANGQVGLVDLDDRRVLDTVALQDRFSGIHGGQPAAFTTLRPGTTLQHLAFANDFSVDLAVSPDGGLVVKGMVLGLDVVTPPTDPTSPYRAIRDGYAAAVSTVGSFAGLAADVSSAAGTPVTTTLLDWTDTGSFDEELLAKSNLSLTPGGEAVALNDQGELIFVDLATGNRMAGLTLPRPGTAGAHYLSASLDQALLVDGATTRSVTLVALSDAPSPAAGYHPASAAVHLIDNSTHVLLPGSMDGTPLGISFNADRGRHALVGYHEAITTRIDARFGLRPPWVGYAIRSGDEVDLVVIPQPQDIDRDGNPDDNGDGRPDVGLRALEEALAVLPAGDPIGGSAAVRLFLRDSHAQDGSGACVDIPPESELVETRPGSGVSVRSPVVDPGSEVDIFLNAARDDLVVEWIAEDGDPATPAERITCPDTRCPLWTSGISLRDGGAIAIVGYPITGSSNCDGEKEIFADLVTQNPATGGMQSAVSDALAFSVDRTAPSAELWSSFVPTRGPVVVGFSEEIEPGVTSAQIFVRAAGGGPAIPARTLVQTFCVALPTRHCFTQVEITPLAPFADYTEYEVFVDRGIRDLAGNPISGSPDAVLPFRTRSRLTEGILEMYPGFESDGPLAALEDLEALLPSELLATRPGETYRDQETRLRVISRVYMNPALRPGLPLVESAAAYIATLGSLLYSGDGYFVSDLVVTAPDRQVVEREGLLLQHGTGRAAIRYSAVDVAGGGREIHDVGFHPSELREDVAQRDGIWTYLPNAFLNRYGALRERGHILVSASELQDALVRYLWLAGARHSPSDEMSGECAGLEYAGPSGTVPDRVECALIYLRDALSGEAAILAGAITSVLLREIGAPVDARVDGWTVADVDELLAALANGRNLVDVTGKTLRAKYGEILCFGGPPCGTPDTTIPGPATRWPPPAVWAAASTALAPFTGGALPADGTFDDASVVDLAGAGAVARLTPPRVCLCDPDLQEPCSRGPAVPFAGAGLVRGETFFSAASFGAAAPIDLRAAGIGTGSSGATDGSDKAVVVALASISGFYDVLTEAFVEFSMPPLVDSVEFKYLYWGENWRNDFAWADPVPYPITLADVVVSSSSGYDAIAFDPGGHSAGLAVDAVAAVAADPCCPVTRMADPLFGQPLAYDATDPCGPGVQRSPAGKLCTQDFFADTCGISGLPCCRPQTYSSACDQPGTECAVREGPPALAVYANPPAVPPPPAGTGPRWRTFTATREELAIAPDAGGWIRIGLRNANPKSWDDPTRPDVPFGCRADGSELLCDVVDDRVQIDDLMFRDCGGTVLTRSSTTAAACRRLDAVFDAIGVTNHTAPGLASDFAWGGIPSVSVDVGAGLPRVTAVPLRVEDFGWRVSARVSPPPEGPDPGAGLALDCRVCSDAAMTACDPAFPAVPTGNLLVCVPDYTVAAGALHWVGGTVRWVDPGSGATARVELPGVAIVVDETPPDGGGIFDTFPANHATFLEGDPVFLRAELLDDTALATFGCDSTPGAPGGEFAASYFPNAHRIPEGNHAALAFEWPTPPIPAAGDFAYVDFPMVCAAKDAVARENGFDRIGRVVRVPDFRVDPPADLPGPERYDDPVRGLRTVDLDASLTVSTDLNLAQLAAAAAAGLLVRYEFAIAPPASTDVTLGESSGTATFHREGIYYIQAVIGRTLTGGQWDPVKISSNVVVALVTGIGAEFLTPWVGSRGVSYPLARFWQDAEVKLVRPLTAADYPRAGVPLEFRTTGGPLVFADYSTVLSGVLTDSEGHATVALYASGVPDPGWVQVYEMRPGRTPDRRFLDEVAIETSRLRITHPTGNPLGATGSPLNEFCFDTRDPGVLTIDTSAVWDVDGTPVGACGADPDSVACRTTWEIEAIGSPGGPPTLAWDDARPDDALHGLGGENRATYTGLPPRYSDFGYRYVHLAYDLWPWESQPIEVFFPRDAANHGQVCASATSAETFRGDSGLCPNFYVYGLQVVDVGPPSLLPLFDSTLPTGTGGETPAVYNWLRYEGPRNAMLLSSTSYNWSFAKEQCPVPGIELWGLTWFLNTVRHEKAHIQQVVIWNTLDFFAGVTGRVTERDQRCPGGHCGWAFSHAGHAVMPGHDFYSRFVDSDGVLGWDPADVKLDQDDDLIPDDYDPHALSAVTPSGRDEFEWVTRSDEECEPDELLNLDWACPGRNAGRAPPRTAAPSDCYGGATP